MRYVLFSKGLHSTWLLDGANATLFDCGEGCSTSLGYQIFAVDRLCLSHSHTDHVAGLPSFLGLRNATKGANDKPLTILYPEGNRRIEEWLEFSRRRAYPLKYALTFQAMKPWDQFPIPLKSGSQEKRYIEAFPVQHAPESCFGYRVLSIRRGLKAEYQGKGPDFYRSLTPQQKEGMMEDRVANQMVFSGDSMPLGQDEDSPLRQAELAFLDCTFLSAREREGFTHAAMEEVAETCQANQVRAAYAMHLSIRYPLGEVRRKSEELAKVYPLKIIPYDQVVRLD